MAKKSETDDVDLPDEDWEGDDDDIELDDEVVDDLDELDEVESDDLEGEDVVATSDDDDDGDDDDDDEEDGAALDELESEELEMLTEDEASEVIPIDERRELRALRREEMALEVDPEQPGSDEFVCQSCFLVKRQSQLADKRRKLCSDCVG